MSWYSQSAAATSLAFGAAWSSWWMNSKAFTILNTSCLSKLSRILTTKHKKKSLSLIESEVQTFLKGQEKSKVTYSVALVLAFLSAFLSAEWKSTTGRFATGRFRPFTWKTSSDGKNRVNKWEFCELKITTIVVFVIMIQRIFLS